MLTNFLRIPKFIIMNFSADTYKLNKDACSSHDDNLLSLLKRPLPNIKFSLAPMSFEDPFDDPNMEPKPLLTSTSKMKISFAESIFGRGEDLFTPLKPTSDDFSQTLLDILNPAIEIADPSSHKRSSDYDFAPPQAKRQRTSQDSEESQARFRPYQEQQWQIQFQNLLQYKFQNGHCCVPHSYPEDPVLARWVKRQRYQYKKFNDGDPTSTMTTRRIQELEAVGFVWHSHHAAWQEKFNELKAFKQQRGHCNVPSHFPENVALSTWVKCQRRQYKLFVTGQQSHMTVERFQELENLGFVFDIRQSKALQASSLLSSPVVRSALMG